MWLFYICSMESLNLPNYEPRIEKRDGKLVIFDPIRKKMIILTPEEWVRQHFINYLLEGLDYPRTRIRVESGVSYNGLLKRSDIVFYNKSLKPQVLIECKAASVKIDQKTFNQLGMYNKTLGAKYMIATNGLVHYACDQKSDGSFDFLEQVPAYKDLVEV